MKINQVVKMFSLSLALLILVACATTAQKAQNPFVGAWNISMDTPMGTMSSILTITPDLTGNMSSAQMGDTPLTNVAVNGNDVSFDAAMEAMGQTIEMKFTGAVDGDNLAGNFASSVGAAKVTGTRAGK